MVTTVMRFASKYLSEYHYYLIKKKWLFTKQNKTKQKIVKKTQYCYQMISYLARDSKSNGVSFFYTLFYGNIYARCM